MKSIRQETSFPEKRYRISLGETLMMPTAWMTILVILQGALQRRNCMMAIVVCLKMTRIVCVGREDDDHVAALKLIIR